MALSLLAGMGAAYAWPTRKIETSEVAATPVSIRSAQVSALGTVAPRGRIRHVAAPSSFARIGRLLVQEGDRVTEGQVLAHADDRPLRASELEQAKTQVAIAQAKLERLLAGPDAHEVEALAAALSSAIESREQRQRDYERANALAKNQTIAREEFEAVVLRLKVANFAVHELTAKQKLLRSVREEDVRVLRAELQAAISRVATAAQNLAISEISAPINGTVLRIHVRGGERPGEAGILELGDTQQMQIIAEVYEADAVRLKIGSAAKAILKSSGRELRGTVTHVRPLVGRKSVLDNDPVTDADARVVEAVIDLTAEDSSVVQAFSNAAVTVIIEVAKR
jgi:HlyD family secretion protein